MFYNIVLPILVISAIQVLHAQPVSLPSEFSISVQETVGKPMPKWRGGFIIQSGSENITGPNFMLYDGRGQGRPIQIRIPDAARIRLNDVVLGVGGEIVIAADIWKESGERASAIATVQPLGNTTIVRRTNPFKVERIALDAEGRIWSFGQNIADSVEAGLKQDHPVLQVFGRDGSSVGAYLMSSSVSAQRLIPVGYSALGETSMFASKDRIGLYIARLKRWVEVSTGTGETLINAVVPLPSAQIGDTVYEMTPRGLAFTASNRLFGYFYNSKAPDYKGTGYYELDKNAGIWRAVAEMNKGTHSMLWGAEEESLLVSTSAAPGSKKYLWVTPPK